MRLSDLLAAAHRDEDDTPDGLGLLPSGTADPDITGLTADSRAVTPGALFVALPGTRIDGRQFIPAALEAGAAAVLTVPGTALPDGTAAVRLADPNPRRCLALLAAAFHGPQPDCLVAVTGTNGKTSVAVFMQQIWQSLGHPSASLGTLGLSVSADLADADFGAVPALTTPDPVALHRLLAAVKAAGCTHLAMEASSHGLDQYRLDGVALKAAAFTNLSRDHLDYHGSMEAYLGAKKRLFTALLPGGATAVLRCDDPAFAALAEAVQARGAGVIAYGWGEAADLRLLDRQPLAAGQHLSLSIGGGHPGRNLEGARQMSLDLPLVGGFQAENALAALGLALATGTALEDALAALSRLRGAPGRLELVGHSATGAPVFVDYAHTPDALATVLDTLRPHLGTGSGSEGAPGRLVAVFGCGGDRDRGKRPLMGRIVAERAEIAIVSDDNPRSEDPAAIRGEILAAMPAAGARRDGSAAVREIGDREEAIAAGIESLQAGDLMVIAGKGHESGQTVGDIVLPFDDRTVARQALQARGGTVTA